MIPNIPRLVPNIPSVALRASTSAFFDRGAVQAAMSEMDLKALSKASMAVRDRARRIIKKKGVARVPFKLQERYPGAGPTALHQMGVLSKRMRDTIIRELQFPPASPPGTPPHTHTPYSGHQASFLGFRRNLWNYYDRQTHSAVAGPSKKGKMLPFLHEFGGTVRLRTWVYIPQIKTKAGGMRRPIMMKLPTGQRPTNQTHWRPMSQQTVTVYPARPFMKPAMDFCVANGSIARAFRGSFRSTAGSRGSGFTVRRG
jgi:hypothetical protein